MLQGLQAFRATQFQLLTLRSEMHPSTSMVILVFVGIGYHNVNSYPNIFPNGYPNIYPDGYPFASEASYEDHCTIIHRTSDGLNETYIFDNQIAANPFNQSVKWCEKLGGKMPIIHSDDDMDFLHLVLKHVKLARYGVWIGAKPVSNTSNCPNQWLDGTNVTYKFDFDDDGCLACERRDCCAVYL